MFFSIILLIIFLIHNSIYHIKNIQLLSLFFCLCLCLNSCFSYSIFLISQLFGFDARMCARAFRSFAYSVCLLCVSHSSRIKITFRLAPTKRVRDCYLSLIWKHTFNSLVHIKNARFLFLRHCIRLKYKKLNWLFI